MKHNIFILLTILWLSLSCSSDDSLTASLLEDKIEKLQNEIVAVIEKSTGETSADCRTTLIPGGNGCGPIYVYGVLGIDTLELESLFDELSSAQTDLYNLQGGPVCDIAFPAKDSLINGSCKACFQFDEMFECF